MIRHILFFLFFLTQTSVFSQDEKKLALIIGNANYLGDAELKNPINDASLIAKTLSEVGFDTIFSTNLKTKRDFINKIKEYGKALVDYDIGLVYYAGHGAQVDGENFLLPTNEEFTCKDDILYYGVKISEVKRYLFSTTNKANVIILDACRDNPFENECDSELSRSFGNSKGNGLAKIIPPSGSLIAFSTSPGDTAADGTGDNSLYCLSLVENLKKENTSLTQIFRNVRSEIRIGSNNAQVPMEIDQLEGEPIFFLKSTFENEFKQIKEIIDNNTDYFYGLELANVILNERPNDKEALKLSAEIYIELKEKEKALEFTNRLIELDPYYGVNNRYSVKGYIYYYLFDDSKNALINYTKAIDIDLEEAINYYNRAYYYYEEEEEWELALADYKKALELNPEGDYLFELAYVAYELDKYETALYYYMQYIEKYGEDDATLNNLANIYRFDLKDYEKALEYYNKAIELVPDDPLYYNNRGNLYYYNLNEKEKALADFTKAIELAPEDAKYYYNRAYYFYEKEEEWELALADYKKALELDPEGDYLFELAYVAYELDKYETALYYYMQYIEKYGEDDATLNNMALIYKNDLKDYEKALEYYNKAIELVPDDLLYYVNRAYLYYYNLNEKEKALADFTKAIELAPDDAGLYYERAINIYEKEEEWELALVDYKKALELDPEGNYFFRLAYAANNLEQYDTALSYYVQYIEKYGEDDATLNNMALIYKNDLKDYEKALEYYNKAIELVPDDPLYYNNRGNLYYYNLNEKEKALADYSKAIELAPEDSDYLDNRADFYEAEKKWDLALADNIKSNQLEPNSISSYYGISYNKIKLKQFQGAIDNYLNALNLEDLENDEKYYLLKTIGATYNFGLNDFKNSKKYLEDAIDLNAKNSDAYLEMGDLFAKNSENKKALEYYNKAIEVDSTNTPIYYRSIFYYRTGQYDLAFEDIKKARNIDPTNPVSYYLDFLINSELNKIKAFSDITLAIEKYEDGLEEDNSDSRWWLYKEYISFINEDRLEINDLYLERTNLYKKFGDNEQYCIELNEIQNILNSEDDKYKKLISELILESCSQ
ncbi:tetratricopeptide repeat protein [bacterium]|nr:tetratricopeptide repeat protein [bacterium]